MTDYREVQHGFETLLHFFSQPEKKTAFIQPLEPCAPGIAMEVLGLFDGWYQDLQLNTYVAALSEHGDDEDTNGRLSMWRAFGGGNTQRVAIVLNIPEKSDGATALSVMFSPVAYLQEKEVHEQLESVIQNIRAESEFLRSRDRKDLLGWLFTMLIAGVTCLKHPGFHEEREWRVVYSPNRWRSPLITSSTETFAGVPQIIHQLPLDGSVSPALKDLDLTTIFDRLIIGPSPYPWAMGVAFTNALTEAGVTDAGKRVFASNIPIRG
jgi:hypothetical protein